MNVDESPRADDLSHAISEPLPGRQLLLELVRDVSRYPAAVDESLDYLALLLRELFDLFSQKLSLLVTSSSLSLCQFMIGPVQITRPDFGR